MFRKVSKLKSHLSTLVPRMVRAALRSHCIYKVVAVGIDSRGRIISLATNTPRLSSRGFHAEERVIFTSPKSLKKIFILRVGARGELLNIDPCAMCQKLARKRGITIRRIQ